MCVCPQPPTRELAVDVSDSLRAEIEQALTMASHLSRDEHQRLTSMTTTLPIPDLIKVSSLFSLLCAYYSQSDSCVCCIGEGV